MKMKNKDSAIIIQKEIFELIAKMDPERLPYAKEALEHIASGRVYAPNAVLVPMFDNLTVGKAGTVEGEVVGYVPTIFGNGNKLIM